MWVRARVRVWVHAYVPHASVCFFTCTTKDELTRVPLRAVRHSRVYSVVRPFCIRAPFLDNEKPGSVTFHMHVDLLRLRLRGNWFQNCSPGPPQNVHLAARIKNVFQRLHVLVLCPPNPLATCVRWHWPGEGTSHALVVCCA